ncbi:hypothetical protein DEO72_LG10g1399 [Vigna unguiculata]|uniref:Uncharacterized protein n=1 Tax=Vigna unguiculata TaxID=3917 RepID=A0A4D6N8L5_VIGUN|nr:hypothetical protein DEO72_LG10g1399 [Vigna unguiculata]
MRSRDETQPPPCDHRATTVRPPQHHLVTTTVQVKVESRGRERESRGRVR